MADDISNLITIQVENKQSLIDHFIEWVKGKTNLIKNNEWLHFKGYKNVSDKYEVDDFLQGVRVDGFGQTSKEILATYKITAIKVNPETGDFLELQLLGYYSK